MKLLCGVFVICTNPFKIGNVKMMCAGIEKKIQFYVIGVVMQATTGCPGLIRNAQNVVFLLNLTLFLVNSKSKSCNFFKLQFL